MCPYVLKVGTIFGKPYKCGDFVPGEKGELADMEESGAVKWVDSPPREPKPKAAPPKPSGPPNVTFKGTQKPAKRKAVK